MRRLAATLGVAVAVVAGAAWWLHEQTPVVPVSAPPPVSAPVRVLAHADPAAAPAPVEAAARRKIEELRALSESVRNSTFVIAIRAAGFMCEDIVDVYASTDAPAWRARCRDSRAYYVRVADTGELAIDPTLDYFDAVGPGPRSVEPDDRGGRDRTPVPLEPQR